MTVLEPVHGYRSALTVDEIVSRMFEFDADTNKLPFYEVLDYWVDQAEPAYKRGQRTGVPEGELDDLEAELNRRKTSRGKAKAMHVELNTAAAEIAQGQSHPYLVLFNAPGGPEFTIKSLYIWAWECHDKVIPEWATYADQVQEIAPPSPSADRTIATATKNLSVTLFMIARALGLMIDKLVEDNHISHPDGQVCVNDDDSENLLAISQYVACRYPSTTHTTTRADSTPIDGADIYEITLALFADALSQLADDARVNNWITFCDSCGDEDNSPFRKQGEYVSQRIYNYLLKIRVVERETKKQGESAILHRLGNAKNLVSSIGLPQLNPEQLKGILEAAHQYHSERNE